MKKHIIIMGGLVVAAVSILLALNFTSGRPNIEKNGFTRKVTNEYAMREKEIVVPKNVTKITCISGDTVYLQTNTPGLIYFTSDFNRIDTIRISVPDVPKLSTYFTTEVHYPTVLICGMNARKVVIADAIRKTNNVINLNMAPGSFRNAVFINRDQIIARCIDTSNFHAIYCKLNLADGSINIELNLSKRLRDAGFTHSAELVYDNMTNFLLAPEFYSNNIKIFDTSLALISNFHTIDTFSVSNFEIRESKTSISNSNPRKHINGAAASSDGVLYVRSYVQADNEMDFADKIPIDRYDIKKQVYTGSFYLPYPRKDGMKNFFVSKTKIFALFDNKLTKMYMQK